MLATRFKKFSGASRKRFNHSGTLQISANLKCPKLSVLALRSLLSMLISQSPRCLARGSGFERSKLCINNRADIYSKLTLVAECNTTSDDMSPRRNKTESVILKVTIFLSTRRTNTFNEKFVEFSLAVGAIIQSTPDNSSMCSIPKEYNNTDCGDVSRKIIAPPKEVLSLKTVATA